MIRVILNIYIALLIVDAVLSYMPELRKANWAVKVKQAADVTLNPVRKILPQDLPLDISPFIVVLAIELIMALW
ncbi:MAG: hypothetical protein A2504_14645 [Bdellovibrionales bacterium RIFOXYD12_FULL_39_22]|nr:MAG: hypothetical protein A2385_15125 [Bdellovibrionales bacterium RIFOXYB1_FULL_39_21]OFZ40535.1 MAG: hypothetical protein A2485_13545 [Bdellovibrionales bacterium RIFOXYC12_FULL_39_17]OFZ49549.1 MAG: hypothetical protein A2404_07860 [Bdellovibrionales bacterium RIFOXYC1_FULL_39_130]OFZ77153.1 MAG: hypothetical protein A2560_17890 [Bdellovibrionales bacterium RIFOXYD1_FULL_39_84]OFZ91429.1 MAG: hypothetical protein A2504_14645 [Bdellovibrionales bacterium RIFOXYD12_FULL_39_22]HLE09753.1 Yg